MDERVSKARVTERLLTRAGGATMRDIIAATGGPQYNELKRLSARGYAIRKVKEGNETRYFASAPDSASFGATMTSKGQVTVPKQIRRRLHLREGDGVRFSIDREDHVTIERAGSRLGDLAGLLGKPKRSVTLEEMDEAIRQAAVNRFLRAVGTKR